MLWVMIGGSYSATALRTLAPNTVYTVWASSALLQTVVAMPYYYDAVASGLSANCSADIAAATAFMDGALGGTNTRFANEVKSAMHAAATGMMATPRDGLLAAASPAQIGEYLLAPLVAFQVCALRDRFGLAPR
jgi:hypothetical protein